MTLTSRVLPPDEWPRLVGTASDMSSVSSFHPANTQVVVVEHEGLIVGTLALIRTVHVHGLWIDESYRREPGAWSRLLKGFRRAARDWCTSVVLTESPDANAEALIHQLGGVEVPSHSTFAIPLSHEDEVTPCHR